MRRAWFAWMTAVGACCAISGRAGADPLPCNLVSVEVGGSLGSAWENAAAELRAALVQELSGRECAPLHLSVEAEDDHVVVHARTPDGREARRVASAPSDLMPIALGILAAAPTEAHVAASAPPDARREANELPAFAPAAPATRDVADAPPSVGVEVGVSMGARVGVPTDVLMWDVEMRADVILRNWLILGFVRYAPMGLVGAIAPDTDAYQEIGAGFGVGRRFRVGPHTLDLSLAPSLVSVAMEVDTPVETSGESMQLRVEVGARYGYALSKSWAFTIATDTGLAPGSCIKSRYPDGRTTLPAIPAWTLGLRLGAAANLL